jgi:phospholipid/cholesterol/gamma-HCH transport system ATP-binding protein
MPSNAAHAQADSEPNDPNVVFRFREVSKAFGDNVVYDAMDLELYAGETLTVIGGSGEGKSVCLKMMIGLLYADEGTVTYHGREVSEMSSEELRTLRTKVSMVFQGGALFDSMNVLENVGYALTEHTDMGDQQIRARVIECLDMVGLGPDRYPEILEGMPVSLSGGMRKRVALARAIALEPEVILYDEPTTGLDPANCNRIARMIRKLQAELGVTSVVVTHDMTTAMHVADRVAMLHERSFPYRDEIEAFRSIEDPVVRDFIEGRAT